MRITLFALLFALSVSAQAPAPAKPAAAKPAGSAKPGTAKQGTAKTAATSSKLLTPALLKAQAPPEYKVKFTTMKDQSFTVKVVRAWSPNGADRFYNMVKNGFFTGVRFYRVSPGFVVQFGVSPDPKVTRAWATANISDDPMVEHNTKGRLTFAKSGAPNSRTTQVFVNLRDNTNPLDSMGFSPFGEIEEGMDVVEGLYSGYGEIAEQGGKGPEQLKVMSEGEAYLKANFDSLDSIKSAVVTFPLGGPASPAAGKKAAAGGAKKAAPAAAPVKK